MTAQGAFESMMSENVPGVDLTRDPSDEGTYQNPDVQVAWVGYQALNRLSCSTTNNTDNNSKQRQSSG